MSRAPVNLSLHPCRLPPHRKRQDGPVPRLNANRLNANWLNVDRGTRPIGVPSRRPPPPLPDKRARAPESRP